MQPYINPNYYAQMNYPYNPPTQPMQQPVSSYQSTQQLARVVPDFNNITVGDIPTNGTPAFFIKGDYSEIQSRRWTEDGRITAETYRLAAPEAQEVKPDPFAEIMARLDAIEDKLPAKAAPRAKKEAVIEE